VLSPAPGIAVEPVSILFVDPGGADSYLPLLRSHFEVTSAASEAQAIRALRTFQPSLVVTDLLLPDGDGVSVCRQSKAFSADPPSVLATTAIPERVPEALLAGCDGVLVKPFAPNLLFTRISRLLRLRTKVLAERAMWQRAKAAHLVERSNLMMSGTNTVWPDGDCPSCGHRGVVSFDAQSHRRMWFACLPCRKVWLGPAPVRTA
jgi:DNA-binding response OmpR family regulator